MAVLSRPVHAVLYHKLNCQSHSKTQVSIVVLLWSHTVDAHPGRRGMGIQKACWGGGGGTRIEHTGLLDSINISGSIGIDFMEIVIR